MTEFIQFILGGLASAAVYAMLGIGWSLMWTVSRSLILLLGCFPMVAGLIFGALYGEHHVALGVAVVVALAADLVLAAATELLLRVSRIGQQGTESVVRRVGMGADLIVTLAGVLVVEQIAQKLTSSNTYVVHNFVGGSPFGVLGAQMNRQLVIVLPVVAVALAALVVTLRTTVYGKALRACAESPVGALACGIQPQTMRLIALLVSAALAGLAACVALPMMPIAYTSAIPFATVGITVSIFGGLGSIGGSTVAGLVVGIGQALIAGYISSERTDLILYALLVLVLLAAPRGLLGFSIRDRLAERRRMLLADQQDALTEAALNGSHSRPAAVEVETTDLFGTKG